MNNYIPISSFLYILRNKQIQRLILLLPWIDSLSISVEHVPSILKLLPSFLHVNFAKLLWNIFISDMFSS
jgi:hypothetical protein